MKRENYDAIFKDMTKEQVIEYFKKREADLQRVLKNMATTYLDYADKLDDE